MKDIIKKIPEEFLDIIEKILIEKNFKLKFMYFPENVFIEKIGNKYAIMIGGMCLGKNKKLNIEICPSLRNKNYFKKYRFDSILEAWEFFEKNKNKIKYGN